MPINGADPATEPGQWQVKLLVNGAAIFTLPFSIVGPPQVFSITAAATVGSLVLNSAGQPNYCQQPPVQASFLTTSAEVGVWFTYNYGQNSDRVVIDWIPPTGATVTTQTTLLNGPGCTAWLLPIAGALAATQPGQWHVNVQVNDVTVVALAFVIAYPAGTITSPRPGSTLAGSTVAFSWTAVSGATEYIVCLGSTSGGLDLGCTSANAATSITLSGIPTLGRTLYAELTTYGGGAAPLGLTQASYTEAYSETSYATFTNISGSGPNVILNPPFTFQWNRIPGASYVLLIGTNGQGSSNLLDLTTSNTALTITSVSALGAILYFQLQTHYPDGTWWYIAYTFREPSGGSGGSGGSVGSNGSGSSGGSGIGVGNGGGSTGTGTGSGWVPGLTCYSTSYDMNQYNPDGSLNATYLDLIVENDCAVSIYVQPYSGIYGSLPFPLLPGDQSVFGVTQSDNPTLYVCPLDYQAVNTSTGFPVSAANQPWACAPD
jgi:uncharacterized membrane protein YgcG